MGVSGGKAASNKGMRREGCNKIPCFFIFLLSHVGLPPKQTELMNAPRAHRVKGVGELTQIIVNTIRGEDFIAWFPISDKGFGYSLLLAFIF